MNIFQAQFSTGQVVEATGVPSATLQTWMNRDGYIVGQREEAPVEGGGGAGKRRRFSFYNIMEIAIAKTLLDTGLADVGHAFAAGRRFGHTGRGQISRNYPARQPGCPYDNAGMSATTLVAVRGERSHIHLWKAGADPIATIWHELGGRGGFVLIDAGEVFERTVTALGYDPVEVMALVYPRPAKF